MPPAVQHSLPQIAENQGSSAGEPSSTTESSQDVKANLSAAELAEQRKQSWIAAEKELPYKENLEKPTNDKGDVLGNFYAFEVKKNLKKPIFRYTIDVGESVKAGVERTWSRETKRYLIGQLLEENTPSHSNWACDYDSIIVSAGSLYTGWDHIKEPEILVPYNRGLKDMAINVTNSKIKFLGFIDIDRLNRHINQEERDDQIMESLHALNIIFCKKVNDKSFTGARSGNKFYPDDPELSPRFLSPSGFYVLRGGLSASVRPAFGSLFLNISTTTSAFLKDGELSSKNFQKNIRVTCNLTGSRQWNARELSDAGTRMSQITFRMKVVQDGQEKLIKRDVRYYLEHESTDGEKMVKVAEILPGQNKRRIAKVLEILGLDYRQPSGHLKTYFEAFGIDFVPKMARLTRKSLSAPKLDYGKINTDKVRGDEDKIAEPVNGAWAITNKRFFSPSKTKTLHVICFHDKSSKIVENIKSAENGLAEVMKAAGMMEHNEHTLDVKLATPETPIWVEESESAIQYRERCQNTLKVAIGALNNPPLKSS
ncbi:hypothetical protein HYALB_00005477 [Hymenoscyphus albidus]|uniref:Uncharacterized protein n=1 Tax=Hymenoscyphus albidus TaxID=595503 RepID=A0A9N9LZC6_9HELO|nr:hypothetical protein HYALB_00005477 [Hymenoscyphus albidus]